MSSATISGPVKLRQIIPRLKRTRGAHRVRQRFPEAACRRWQLPAAGTGPCSPAGSQPRSVTTGCPTAGTAAAVMEAAGVLVPCAVVVASRQPVTSTHMAATARTKMRRRRGCGRLRDGTMDELLLPVA